MPGGCSFPPEETPQEVYAEDGSPLHIIATAQSSSTIQNDTVILTPNPPYSHEESSSESIAFSDYSAPPVPPFHKRASDGSEPYERDYEDYITEPAVPIIISGTDEPQFHGDDNNGKPPHD